MNASAVSDLLFSNLSFRSERQKVISSNIANINTPGYKTKELTFENELTKVNNKNDLKLYTTHNKHMGEIKSLDVKQGPSLKEVQGLEEQNDGNNVNLDSQMGELAKNQMIFNALTESVKKDSRLFRSVIESSAKN